MVKISDIIDYLEKSRTSFTYYGNKDSVVSSYCPLNNLKEDSITWIRDVKNYNLCLLNGYKNMLVVCNQTDVLSSDGNVNFIFTDNPHSVYFSVLNRFFKQSPVIKPQIGTSSVIETINIGQNVSIGHFCYIGKDVIIGDNVIIENNVSIEGKVNIGQNTVICSGVVIGMDGYGFYDDINGSHIRVPHLGGVIIGENVEIGANTCIAKGCLGDTIIHDDVKIDNLCHIAHNVVIGKKSKIIALTMLAGSSIIGEDVWVAPCAAVKNQVTVGDHSLVGMGAVVTKDVEPDIVVAGVPAKPLRKNV